MLGILPADEPLGVLTILALVGYVLFKDILAPLVKKVTEDRSYRGGNGHALIKCTCGPAIDELKASIEKIKSDTAITSTSVTQIKTLLVGMEGQEGGGMLGEVAWLRKSKHDMAQLMTELSGRQDNSEREISLLRADFQRCQDDRKDH